jgi:hypothetical protein
MLTCYLCPKECRGVDDYVSHLRNRHSLIEPCSLQCNAGGCLRTFTSYRSLRRHIRHDHANFLATDQECNCSQISENASSQQNAEQSHDAFNNESSYQEPIVVDTPAIDQFGVSKAALKFIMGLSASCSLPLSAVDFVRRSTAELVRDILQYLKSRVVELLKKVGGDILVQSEVSDLLHDFDCWNNPFKGIESEQQLLSYLKKKQVFIAPVPYPLGKRWDVRHNQLTNKRVQVEVTDSFYYIPLEETLKLVLTQPDSWNLISRHANQCEAMQDWVDGENGRNLMKYHQNHSPHSIPLFIQFYFDEVETVNPLGSKTGVHKLGAFYCVIKNFPPAVNSSLQNIHLVALAHAVDLKKHSVDAVLQVLVDQLMQLHDIGFYCDVNGTCEHFVCYLTQVVGDNLGLHAMLGFVENFSRATYCCDICMASQDDMQSVFREDQLVLRTVATYEDQVAGLMSGSQNVTDSGIKRPSCLTRLPYYHPMSNYSADIMHDLMEGVIPLETKLFIHSLVYDKKLISLPELNNRIKTADYGRGNSRNIPSCLMEWHVKSQDSNLGQRAAQMLTLFKYLPIIVHDVIEQADPSKLQLFQLLHEIVEIVLLPVVTPSHIAHLQDIVLQHHTLYKSCYPDRKMIYKHHRMVHYGTVMRHSGPLLRMMVMRYEGKHNYFKRLAHIVCNFKNIAWSASQRHQIFQAFNWISCSPLAKGTELGSGIMVGVAELLHSDMLSVFTGTDVDVFVTNKVVIGGQEYRVDSSILIGISDDGEPTFAVIRYIYVQSESVYFVVEKWHNVTFNHVLRAYSCCLTESFECITAEQVMDYKPYFAVDCSKEDCAYRHIVIHHQICSDLLH